jgi:hypothetical protein
MVEHGKYDWYYSWGQTKPTILESRFLQRLLSDKLPIRVIWGVVCSLIEILARADFRRVMIRVPREATT